MKDMLGRDIMVGDTLAFVENPCVSPAYPNARKISTAQVRAASSFALQLVKGIKGDEEPKTFVISEAEEYVICDWAKGSDAAK